MSRCATALALLLAVALPAAEPTLGPRDRWPFRMDFAVPACEGVDDLQVVHASLVILGNDYTLAARQRAIASRQAELDAIKAQGGNLWVKAKRYDQVLRDAFIAVYNDFERLDDPAFFAVTSPDDPAYRTARPPARVTRFATTRGNFRDYHLAREREGTAGNLLANFSYLSLPAPLQTGRTYTITQGDGRRVTFTFDEDLTISRALKVNQAGYGAPARRKYAYLGLWQPGVGPVDFGAFDGRPFEVVDADTRRVVHTGSIRLLARDPQTRINKQPRAASGEDLYELDLSGLTHQGDVYVRMRGIGRSWPFHHGQAGLGRAFFLHLRGLWHQRAGHALDARYTAWARPAAHTAAFEADYHDSIPYNNPPLADFEAIRRTATTTEVPPAGGGGVGGWYDAADYDRRWFHYDAIWDLLLAYEVAPRNFTDGQAATGESGNGIPDLLDEVAWGLLVWRHSQTAAGGVATRCEQTSHPSTADQKPNGMPQYDTRPMYFSGRTREGSLRYAAAAAHLSRLLRPFDPAAAAGWLDSASRAWTFGRDPANTWRRDDYARTGQPFAEAPELIAASGCLAGLQMYLTSRRADCLQAALEWYPASLKAQAWPIKFVRDHFWWAFFADAAIPPAIRDAARADFLARADAVEQATHQAFYRLGIPNDYPYGTGWGKAIATHDARYLIMGYALTGDRRYLDAAALCADWVQGCNPLGVSWTSGVGYAYPWCFLDAESEEDGILDPVPGLTVYAPGGGMPMGAKQMGLNIARYDNARREYVILKRLQPEYVGDLPYWRCFAQDFHDAPAMQEFTVWETISPNVLVYGVLLGEGWQPDAALRAMTPREEPYLFGRWLTP